MLRRSFLLGLLAAPAIVRADSLMKVKPLPAPPDLPLGWLDANYWPPEIDCEEQFRATVRIGTYLWRAGEPLEEIVLA